MMTNNRSRALGLSVLVALFVVGVVGLLPVGPIPQDPAYHTFADTRTMLGVPNFGNVASNLGFLLVGLAGIGALRRAAGRAWFDQAWHSRPYWVFFAAVSVVCLGSGYYHLWPSTDALFWDRLPMAIAFMALFAAVIADRVSARVGAVWGLPVLILLGISSLGYWDWTESFGRGDLRAYVLVQFFPLAAIPPMLWLFPLAQHTRGKYLGWGLVWYGTAKVLEHFDAWIFDYSAQVISGHSLKHLASAMAAFMVLRMLTAKSRERRTPVALS
jgi:hypothetical protein